MGALTQVGPILADLVAKSAAALAAEDRPVDSVVTVAPGVAPAWDNSCSQIYSRFVSLAPVTGDQRGVQAPCGVLFWIVTVAIAVTRCVGTPSAEGGRIKLPTPDRVSADGMAMLADIATLEDVIKCDERVRSVVQAIPLPEAGGLSGIEWQFTLRIDNCNDCA